MVTTLWWRRVNRQAFSALRGFERPQPARKVIHAIIDNYVTHTQEEEIGVDGIGFSFLVLSDVGLL